MVIYSNKLGNFIILSVQALCCAVFFLFLIGTALASGPPEYLPDDLHPRIWLTPTLIDEINVKQVANHVDWSRLEDWCDSHINTTGYDKNNHAWDGGYQGSSYKTYLINFGMAYHVLKDDNAAKAETYATYAKKILDGMVSSFSAGEETDGIRMIRQHEVADRTVCDAEAVTGVPLVTYKEGYAARNFGTALALGYDWFYSELSPAQKVTYRAVMYRWIDWYRGVRSDYNNGILKSGIRYHEDNDGVCDATNKCPTIVPDDMTFKKHYGYHYDNAGTNYWGGYFLMTTLAAIATYDSADTDTATYWTLAKDQLWEKDMKPLLQSPLRLKGGDSPEGPYYSGIAFDHILKAMEGVRTATGSIIFDSEFQWPVDILASRLYQSYGSLDEMISRGDWASSYASDMFIESTGVLLPMLHMANSYFPSASEVRWAKYYLNNGVFAVHSAADAADRLLWDVSDIAPAVNLTSIPLDWRAEGTGFVSMRSAWDANAVFASINLEGGKSMDHEAYDDGHLLISRGKNHLLTFRNGDSTIFNANNNIVFSNEKPIEAFRNDPRTEVAIDRYVSETDYLYVRGDTAHAWEWGTAFPAGVNEVLLNYRSLLYLRPGMFVVYDVTRSNTASKKLNKNIKEFYTQYEANPIVEESTVTVSVGSSKLFVKTLSPSGSYTESNPNDGYWRVKFTPTITQEYDHFLHVIEATDKTQPAMTKTVLIDAVSNNMRGVYISDLNKSDNNWVAMFTADKEGALVNADISYVVPAAVGYPPFGYAPKHIFMDLPPNTEFTFIAPKSKNVSPQLFSLKRGASPNEGRVYTSSSQGVVLIESSEKLQIR